MSDFLSLLQGQGVGAPQGIPLSGMAFPTPLSGIPLGEQGLGMAGGGQSVSGMGGGGGMAPQGGGGIDPLMLQQILQALMGQGVGGIGPGAPLLTPAGGGALGQYAYGGGGGTSLGGYSQSGGIPPMPGTGGSGALGDLNLALKLGQSSIGLASALAPRGTSGASYAGAFGEDVPIDAFGAGIDPSGAGASPDMSPLGTAGASLGAASGLLQAGRAIAGPGPALPRAAYGAGGAVSAAGQGAQAAGYSTPAIATGGQAIPVLPVLGSFLGGLGTQGDPETLGLISSLAVPGFGTIAYGLGSMLGGMLKGPNTYVPARAGATGEINRMAPALMDQLLMAQSPEALERAISAAQSGMSRVRLERGQPGGEGFGFGGAYDFQPDVINQQLGQLLGLKQAQFGGQEVPGLMDASALAQQRWQDQINREAANAASQAMTLEPSQYGYESRPGALTALFGGGPAFQTALQQELARLRAQSQGTGLVYPEEGGYGG